ncbi:AMP-binding protein [Aliiglaciecola lipolytica]|uniref:AMP-binding protein n=1 Tax=Aliiglaciecola lipolytica TaxID=477689 RepID=UPI001C092934|nr:AMP-binding protein [Aliiglaciecola lipolytica]MBU2879371.1 AMP-binding protein [Aliiglaciecola lipolytica]
MTTKTPLELFYEKVKSHPNKIYLTQPLNGKVTEYSWQQVDQKVRQVAQGLTNLGLPKGSHIGLISKNCAEWFITDLAIMMAGHISIPIFPTAGPDTISYVLDHAKCPVVFVGKLEHAAEQIAAIPDGIKSIAFPYAGNMCDVDWETFTAGGEFEGYPVPDMKDVMTIIYTSGSTGAPKGVVQTYESVSWTAKSSLSALSVNEQDRILSYLPLAHITERILVEMASLYSGLHIFFIESLDTFKTDIQRCQPTLFISVPRLWTRFQMGVLAQMPQRKLERLLRIPIIGGIVAKKIRKGLGLDNARLCASGSAPIPPATIHWFHRIGIEICEGWGMTENCAYGTSSVPFREDKIGCIGKAYEGVDIRIAEDGEIQVKGPCNMKEYYLEAEKTAEVFTEDGYLRTGDKGELDNEGYIRITGRLKDIFKTAKGKYVTPVPIESLIMENEIVEQVCVTGSDLKQPIALLIISEIARKQSAEQVIRSLEETVHKVNANLESHQVLDRLVVVEDDWTIENDLLTPTLKIKRHVLEKKYKDVINAPYKEKVVWLS